MSDLNKKRIAIIIGTRAELIKTFPLIIELQKEEIPYYFIHTGQHSLKNLCETFNINKPDIVLTHAPKGSSKFFAKQLNALLWNMLIVFKIKRELKKLKNLKYVLYHGDTMTTTCAAIASSKILNPFKKYKNAHLEAGLRSGFLFEPFPEEISRIISDKFSDILFAVSRKSEENLSKHKNTRKIINIGNTIVDSVNISYEIAKKKKIKKLSNKNFALISIHRHENIKNKERLTKIINILSSLKIDSYFSMYDNTRNQLLKFGLYNRLKENKNIKIIESLNYINFISQIKNCSIIICDGGSLQEESLIFQKPCIILRKALDVV